MSSAPQTSATAGGPGDPVRRSPRQPNGDVVLTRAQVSALCGFSGDPHAADRLVARHADFPRPFYPFPRSPRWLRRDVETWLRKHARAAQVQEVQLP